LRCSILDYLQTITIPTPFPVGPINVYLANGDEPTLIDTGPKDPATLPALRDALAARGLAFKDIRRVIVTHAHVDHFGLAAQIVAESGARVLSHSRNRWWLTDFEHEWMRRHDFYHDMFMRGGAPREYADGVVSGMRRITQYAASVPAENFVALEDGDTLALGGEEWRVVFAPGHASGLICLHNPAARALISSDHLLRDITSNPVLEPPTRGEAERPRALVDYLASMEKTAQLDARVALPAHGEPIYDIRALVDGRLAFHRSRLEHIEQQLDCCAQTPYEICNILFPNLKAVDMFLGLSEVIGHLDVLEAEGRVRREEDNGLVRFIPTRKA
jgi:glyoxylase-like metal-dependent hydrolase (beta-lactamase superfamily II)